MEKPGKKINRKGKEESALGVSFIYDPQIKT
jgi:hypothetical protein